MLASRCAATIALAALTALVAPAPAASADPVRAWLGPDRPAATPVAPSHSRLAARSELDADELRDELAAAMRSAGGASGAWAFDVDAAGDGLLYAEDAAKRRIPASNQKLFTTAAFLDRFGAEHRLETRVYARGERRGTGLSGDLVVVGDGDPALGTVGFARRNDQPVTRISKLAGAIAQAGIQRVAGSVRADDSVFDRRRRSGPYLSPLSGLSFNNGFHRGQYARAPELVAASQLGRSLRRRGVAIAGGIGRARLGAGARAREPLATVASPPAAALIEETNVPSNNFFAEMLLKRVAAADGAKGTRRRGARRVEAFARRAGTDVEAADGSGLSRRNAASPQEVGALLVAMARDGEHATAFADSLPVAGREGTVAYRMRGTAAEGNCATKTGTLSGVSALSGYCEAGAHTIAFSILMNEVEIGAAHRAQDRFAAALARYEP